MRASHEHVTGMGQSHRVRRGCAGMFLAALATWPGPALVLRDPPATFASPVAGGAAGGAALLALGRLWKRRRGRDRRGPCAFLRWRAPG